MSKSRTSLGELAKRATDGSINAAREVAAGFAGALPAYDRLLREVSVRTEMLSRRALRHAWEVNRALLAMALHHADWLMPVECWSPPKASGQVQLASLAEHLFARFPMPQFMASVWHRAEPGTVSVEQGWYKLLGLGQNIRSVNVPMRITRGMAHRLLSAPRHLSMVAALRWSQITDLGGSEELVQSILATRLGRVLDNEDFWEGVIHFFVNHPELPLDQVGPVVDFLQPPQPELSLKGRSCASVLRLVREWHRALARTAVKEVSWAPAPFGDFRWLEKRRAQRDARANQPTASEDRLWTISELRTSRELFVEGRVMRHCVSTYVRSCVERRSSIWSMQAETQRGKDRILTIDVALPSRRVVQARRKCNEAPGPMERAIVRRWAEREGITIPPTLRDLQ